MQNSPINIFDQQLAQLKSEVDELEGKLQFVDAQRDQLKPHVQTYQELMEKRRDIRKSIKSTKHRLNIILDFIKDSTGEETYAMFPLFSQQNQEPYETLLNKDY
jgi:chromosome segregation ATPase